MKLIFVGTDKEPFVLDMEDELNNFQSLVGGLIEVYTIKTNNNRSIDFIFNEEYEYLFSEINKTVITKEGYVINVKGNILVVATNETTGEFESLTEEELKFYLTFLLDDKLFI